MVSKKWTFPCVGVSQSKHIHLFQGSPEHPSYRCSRASPNFTYCLMASCSDVPGRGIFSSNPPQNKPDNLNCIHGLKRGIELTWRQASNLPEEDQFPGANCSSETLGALILYRKYCLYINVGIYVNIINIENINNKHMK